MATPIPNTADFSIEPDDPQPVVCVVPGVLYKTAMGAKFAGEEMLKRIGKDPVEDMQPLYQVNVLLPHAIDPKLEPDEMLPVQYTFEYMKGLTASQMFKFPDNLLYKLLKLTGIKESIILTGYSPTAMSPVHGPTRGGITYIKSNADGKFDVGVVQRHGLGVKDPVTEEYPVEFDQYKCAGDVPAPCASYKGHGGIPFEFSTLQSANVVFTIMDLTSDGNVTVHVQIRIAGLINDSKPSTLWYQIIDADTLKIDPVPRSAAAAKPTSYKVERVQTVAQNVVEPITGKWLPIMDGQWIDTVTPGLPLQIPEAKTLLKPWVLPLDGLRAGLRPVTFGQWAPIGMFDDIPVLLRYEQTWFKTLLVFGDCPSQLLPRDNPDGNEHRRSKYICGVVSRDGYTRRDQLYSVEGPYGRITRVSTDLLKQKHALGTDITDVSEIPKFEFPFFEFAKDPMEPFHMGGIPDPPPTDKTNEHYDQQALDDAVAAAVPIGAVGGGMPGYLSWPSSPAGAAAGGPSSSLVYSPATLDPTAAAAAAAANSGPIPFSLS